MSENIKILLFDIDETSKVLIENYIKELTFDCSFSKYNEFDEDLISSDNSKKIIAVNLNGGNLSVLNKIKSLSSNKNNYFIVLSYDKSADLHVKALRAGAKEFIYKPVIKSDFLFALQQFYKREIMNSEKNEKAVLSSVIASQNETGKTFFALNTAKELADISKEDVLLVDFNNNLNDISTRLNASFEYSTTYFIDKSVKEKLSIKKNLLKYPNSSLYVMGNGVFRYNYTYNEDTFNSFIDILKREFKYIVADTNSDMASMNDALLKKSDDIFLITEPSVSMYSELFAKVGPILYDKRLKLILNKYAKNKHEGILPALSASVQKNIYVKIPKNYIATNASIVSFKTLKEITPDLDIVTVYKMIASGIMKRV